MIRWSAEMRLARLTENTKVVCLGTLGEWTYIEAEEDGVRLRGFVPHRMPLCHGDRPQRSAQGYDRQLAAVLGELHQRKPHHVQ